MVDFDALEIIEQRHPEAELVTRLGETQVFLPATKAVWNQVRSETPVQARAILARQGPGQERRLEVLGLSVPQTLVSWSFPILVLAIGLHLLAHVLHLHRLLASDRSIREYPWMAIMPDLLPRFLTAMVLLVIPTVALAGTVIASWEEYGSLVRVVLLAISLAGMGVLWVCHNKLRLLRRTES